PRTRNRSSRVLQEADALMEVVIPDDQQPPDDVRVSVEVLGRRMEDDVRPLCKRALVEGRGEGVVHAEQRPGPASDLRYRAQVGQPHHRVGWRLHVHQSRTWLDGRGYRIGIARINEGEAQAQT